MAFDFLQPRERLDASSTATIVVGDHCVILYANAAAAALIGLEVDQLLGQALDLPYAPGETREVSMIGAGDAVLAIRLVTETVDWENQPAFEVALHVAKPSAPAPAPIPVPIPAPAPPPPAPIPVAAPAPVPAPPAPISVPAPPAPIQAPAPVPPAPAPVSAPVPPAPAPVAAPAPAPIPEPAAVPAPTPLPTPELAAAAPKSSGPPAKPLRILILEDDAAIGDIQCRMLKTLGYLTVWTKTGEEAIEACKKAVGEKEPFAGALLDLTIHGGMGGRDAVKVLKTVDPVMKAIACSGYSDDELNQELMKDGFIDILPKPFRSQELGKILKKNVG